MSLTIYFRNIELESGTVIPHEVPIRVRESGKQHKHYRFAVGYRLDWGIEGLVDEVGPVRSCEYNIGHYPGMDEWQKWPVQKKAKR